MGDVLKAVINVHFTSIFLLGNCCFFFLDGKKGNRTLLDLIPFVHPLLSHIVIKITVISTIMINNNSNCSKDRMIVPTEAVSPVCVVCCCM